mgnify:CR=1 FL=1
MIQEIVALLIVLLAVIYAVRSIYIFFRSSGKGRVCTCKSCPSNEILKEIKKAQKA